MKFLDYNLHFEVNDLYTAFLNGNFMVGTSNLFLTAETARAVGPFAALRYLHRVKAKPARLRFDVVEVVGTPEAGAPRVRHIENAFSLGPGYRLPW